MRGPYRLEQDPAAAFPPAELALDEPNGLLAVGGDLTPTRLLNAYRAGIFPWYSQGQPILWWSPAPRTVLRTGAVHLSRRFLRGLRHSPWQVTADTAFAEVVVACAQASRPGQDGTWILPDMQQAYLQLHLLGHAHSVEVRDGETLVGGIYGVAVGRMFYGESMFSGTSGGSKVALAVLARVLHGWGWPLLDAQVANPHLDTLGAESWPRQRFLQAIAHLTGQAGLTGRWTGAFGLHQARELADG